jgi:monofunctional glycosyltransferase
VAFLGRIALSVAVDPASTSFQRSQAWRIASSRGSLPWAQEWVSLDQISEQLWRAVIVSEDAGFASHGGIDWESLEGAWARNQREMARTQRTQSTQRSPQPPNATKVVGGSTISQQLAKNLLLSGERTLLRKGQEFVLTAMLEALLGKRRILEIYLNSVEWGEGVFGAQAAARHYFQVDAKRLSAWQAARLAVMLPAPKRFERLPNSAYLASRSATVLARMPAAALP